MKLITRLTIIIFVLTISSCKVEEIISELGNSKITAKEKLGEVLNAARTDFSADAQLAAIYGSDVDSKGEIDLLRTNGFNAFIYAVQSNALQMNEFYIPVYNSSPIKSPANFDTIISFVKDTSAIDILNVVFGKLSDISVDPSASYDDSPEALNKLLTRNDVTSFRTANPDTKIDMILVPSKAIDTTSVVNSADWVVNFHSVNGSLVLWINSTSGDIKNLSEL